MANQEISLNPTSLLTKPWQKFLARFNEIDTIKISQWKEIHILAYIYKRYEQTYKRKYSITIKNAPSKCPDMFMTKSIISSLNTSNMNIVKSYIDWVFDKKIIPQKKVIRTLGFFTTYGFYNEFLAHKKESEIIKRSTELPLNYKELANSLDVEAQTYGDLGFIKLTTDRIGNDLTNKHVQFMANLEAMGFDLKILEELKQ